jgi:amino acid transporter
MDDKSTAVLTPTQSTGPSPGNSGINLSQKKGAAKHENTNAIIATVLSTLICILLFIDGFFRYSFRTYGRITGEMTIDKYSDSFSHLTSFTKLGFLFPAIIIFASVVIIIASWLKIKRGIKPICSVIAIIVLIIGIFIGKTDFYLADSDTYTSIWRDFSSLGILFYTELILMLALLVVGFLQDLKKEKTDLATTKDTKTEYQATSIKETTTVVQVASPAEEIKKYKELLDSGIISQEEFDSKKNQLLGL